MRCCAQKEIRNLINRHFEGAALKARGQLKNPQIWTTELGDFSQNNSNHCQKLFTLEVTLVLFFLLCSFFSCCHFFLPRFTHRETACHGLYVFSFSKT